LRFAYACLLRDWLNYGIRKRSLLAARGVFAASQRKLEEEVGVTLSQGLRFEVARDCAALHIDEEAVRYLPAAFAFRHDVIAFGLDGSDLLVAVPEGEPAAVDRIRLLTGMHVRATTLPREEIREYLAVAYAAQTPSLREDDMSSPATRIVDEIQAAAVRCHASDVHIEPTNSGGRVRQRVDGQLCALRSLSVELYAQVVARLKVLAALDVADRRQPQDGRYSFQSTGRMIDARVSAISTIDGERLVVRLFDSARQRPCLDELGMDQETVGQCRQLVRSAHGFVIVCGPTGSGKTTTLYAAMEERKSEREHLCTIEDPIEVRMSGVAQIAVNVRAGMTFARALRAVLRQDPDVVMIGETRDTETANVAMSAALSGQLVLTTMHGFDAARAVERLLDLEVPRHAIAAALTGIIAQRLVRVRCGMCGGASDCQSCSGSGFSGRTGIFECVTVSDQLRDAIASGASSLQLAQIIERFTGTTLARDGLRHVMAGRTTAAELQRVLGDHSRQ
jgi:type II secretory ATPase GspE/PulE/Tfp pilus assembly ATPase PilB-like protein